MKPFLFKPLAILFMGIFLAGVSASYSDTRRQMQQGDPGMNTYAIFLSFTQQGMQDIKESPQGFRNAQEIVKSMGGEVRAFYGMLGSKYDALFIVNAQNDEAVGKMVLAIASRGNVSTRTHRLFTETEFNNIVTLLP